MTTTLTVLYTHAVKHIQETDLNEKEFDNKADEARHFVGLAVDSYVDDVKAQISSVLDDDTPEHNYFINAMGYNLRTLTRNVAMDDWMLLIDIKEAIRKRRKELRTVPTTS